MPSFFQQKTEKHLAVIHSKMWKGTVCMEAQCYQIYKSGASRKCKWTLSAFSGGGWERKQVSQQLLFLRNLIITSSGSLLPHSVTQILNHKRAGMTLVPARLGMDNRSVGVQLNIGQKQIVCCEKAKERKKGGKRLWEYREEIRDTFYPPIFPSYFFMKHTAKL